jgi:hypothetical protein
MDNAKQNKMAEESSVVPILPSLLINKPGNGKSQSTTISRLLIR